MAQLLQLTNGATYRACEWDLKADPQLRRYWVEIFCSHIDTLMSAISQQYPQAHPDVLASFRADYLAAIGSVQAEPERFQRLDILTLDGLRADVQKKYGFNDPYGAIKSRENDLALTLLPDLLAELDATLPDPLVEKLATGLMAGNLFDLGAAAAIERYRSQPADFRQSRAAQPKRPWLIDSLGVWRKRWVERPYRHVAFFVDNAGADICLGCLPLARWMLRNGSRVTLVANSDPALNDVTARELAALLDIAAEQDKLTADAASDEQLSLVGSGGAEPLIDLTQLTNDCVERIAEADLIILHGMGRAVESNFRATFSCDSLRTAVLKDQAVARWLGGRLFDCVFWYHVVDGSP